MDRDAVIEILEGYRSGSVSQAQALEKLTCLPFEDMDDIKIDHHRALRQGFPEVVFCPGNHGTNRAGDERAGPNQPECSGQPGYGGSLRCGESGVA